ncbi:MAG: hypothetical protein M1832_003608 [Thelocarpon impressellum]|nr:MAG: hypothetical protein M1832_003608 [Thelocarpon impressellum]
MPAAPGAVEARLPGDGLSPLQRSSSHASTASAASRRSDRVRSRPRKPKPPSLVASASTSTVMLASPSDKSLTSFPSLSPPTSPASVKVVTPTNAAKSPASSTFRKASEAQPPSVEGLMMSTPALARRTALFDDAPLEGQLVPGALHHTTDEHMERLIARNGAVALVRQLATDLAQRDAQASALRRRAEERERILRRMLLECEVSNMDIESRLSSPERPRSRESNRRSVGADDGQSLASGLDEMMGQAMRDEVGPDDNAESGFFATSDADPRQATLRPRGTTASSDDSGALGRAQSSRRGGSRRTTRGWKEFVLGSGETSRKASRESSVAGEPSEVLAVTPMARVPSGGPRRKGLQSDLFQPPDAPNRDPSLPSVKSDGPAARKREDSGSDTRSSRSSTSIAAWALKLVAGNTQAVKREAPAAGDDRTTRERSAASASRSSAVKPFQPNSRGKNVRQATPTLSLGPNGTLKGAAPSVLELPSSPKADDGSNSGPVEMDTILPPDSQPPTLTQAYNAHHPTEFLTDRFGFIYDQRRKRRQREAAEAPGRISPKMEMLSPARDTFASHGLDGDGDGNGAGDGDEQGPESDRESAASNSRPGTGASDENAMKGLQDFLATATFPTELLSHTPSAGAVTTLHTVEADTTPRSAHVAANGRGPLPSASANPQPQASPVVADNATLSKPAASAPASPLPGAKEQAEPVRLLLAQLTELHDSLQRERTVKWNDFLRKVRAERRRDGEGADRPAPEVSLADGEMVGVAGLGNKGKVGRAKWNEFKRLVLGGIPVAYRAKIWAECSGAAALRVPGQYDELAGGGVEDGVVAAQIAMDINRTLTDNVFFRRGPGVPRLNEVLLAYAHRNAEVGYCQGMNLIAASLLLIMPSAEEAFWVLASLIESILPPHYYDHSLLASRADQQVLRHYVRELLPALSAHLDALGVELEALTFQWFLSVFTDCLSAEALFRVWDVVLCTNDGSTFLFQVALALLKLNEPALLQCRAAAAAYAYINHHMTNHAISIDGLLQASDALKRVVRREDVERRRAEVVAAEQAAERAREEATERRRAAQRGAEVEEVSVQEGAGGAEPGVEE